MRRSVRDAAERAPERARRHQSPACLGAPQKSPGHDGPGDDAYGGDEGIRTLGLCLAKAALSQLSYIPVLRACRSYAQEPELLSIQTIPNTSHSKCICIVAILWGCVNVYMNRAFRELLAYRKLIQKTFPVVIL